MSPNGEHLIRPDTKTYARKSRLGLKDIGKAKGFSLHYANQQIFNFSSLKAQVIIKALSEDIQILMPEHAAKQRKLTMHNINIKC